ncbi:MAG: 6-hydroxymethylpterin diphosphokinase MptE-like protein [Leptospirales bacterium]
MNFKLDKEYSARINLLLERTIPEDRSTLQALLSEPPTQWVETLSSILETGTFSLKNIWYHSRRDPVREVNRVVDAMVKNNRTGAILLGAGLGYLVKELLINKTIEFIAWIEPDAEMVFYFLNLFSLEKILSETEAEFILLHKGENNNLEELVRLLRGKNLDKVEVIPHTPSKKAHPEKYLGLEPKLKEILEIRTINQATIIKFQNLWNSNIALNVGAILQGLTLNEFIDTYNSKFTNIVICGAGPSLCDSIENLKINRNNYFLICADTAFLPLVRGGVTPDLVIGADPQSINRYFAYHAAATETMWMLDPVVSYQMVHYLQQRKAKIFWWDNPFYLDEMVRNLYGDRGVIAHGGSASTNAFDLAIKLGAEKIILVGQDLAYTHNLAHTRGAALEERVFHSYNRFSNYEMVNYKQMKAHPLVKIEPIKPQNETLFSTAKLNIFVKWFEQQAAQIISKKTRKPVLFNATKQGIRLKHFSYKPLEEILTEKNNLKPELISKSSKQCDYTKLKTKLATLKKDTLNLEELYRKNLKHQKDLENSHNPATKSQILASMKKVDNRISSFPEVNKILGLNAQHIILQITESDKGKSNDAESLYKTMILSAKRTSYLFKKALTYISLR